MPGPPPYRDEDAFVTHYLAPLTEGDPAAMGLKDDAALIQPRDGHSLIVTCDTLIQDRHFLFDGTPASAAQAAHKALAVNVSDLAAKGATPRAYLMSLALPPGNFDIWMPAFVDALAQCQRRWTIPLIGGDTLTSPDPGPLSITITAIGEVPGSSMVTRSKAAPGDGIYITGTIGDASLGLRLCLGKRETVRWADLIGDDGCEALKRSYRTPQPRVKLAGALRKNAHAAIDVSDGFVRDLTRICRASVVGAKIDAQSVPLSHAARILVEAREVSLSSLLTGGDDYEIIACVQESLEPDFKNAAAGAAQRLTRIGKITQKDTLQVIGSSGVPMEFVTTGWDHLEQSK